MSRIELPKSALTHFPFRLLPHFQFSSEALEKTLSWEHQFQQEMDWPTISLALEQDSEISNESLKVQSSPLDINGEYLLVTAPGTILHPSSIFIIKKQLKKNPCELVYWDECSYDPKSFNLSHYSRKGRPSKLSFLGRNVIGNYAVVKASLWNEILSAQSSIEEKLWAVSLESKDCLHIPLALSSTSGLPSNPEDSCKNILFKLKSKLKDLNAQSVITKAGSYGVKTQVELLPIDAPVGIVIPFKNQSEITIKCIRAIARQVGAGKFHLRLINNSSLPEERNKIESVLKANNFSSAKIIDDNGYFNYARLNNQGITDLLKLGCKDLVLMNNDIELDSENFISQAQAWSRFKGVGLVGGTLSYPSGTIQSAGINFSQVRPANVSAEHMHSDKLREVDGLCFALVLIRDSALEALGGRLDEIECPNGYGDTLFCQKARDRGFLSLHVPWLRATHHESASRGIRPEELELLELVQNGLRISDLWSDLEAERQPMIIPLGPTSSSFQAVVRQVSSSRKMLATAEAVCKPIVQIGKGIRRKLAISKLN